MFIFSLGVLFGRLQSNIWMQRGIQTFSSENVIRKDGNLFFEAPELGNYS